MMQVTNKLNLDVSSEPKAPSSNSANGSDRGFSSLLDNQNSATSPAAAATTRAEARAQASANAEKNRAKSEDKAASAEEATRQDEISAAAQSESEQVAESEGSLEEIERQDAAEAKVENDAAAVDPALSGIDFLQHLQSSLNTNTELTTDADTLTGEAQGAKSEAANGGNGLPLAAGSLTAAEVDADDELLTDEPLAARANSGATAEEGADSGSEVAGKSPVTSAGGSTGGEKTAVSSRDNSAELGTDATAEGKTTVASAGGSAGGEKAAVSSRDNSAELSQLAALFAGGSKREVASPATTAAPEALAALDDAAQAKGSASDVASKLESSGLESSRVETKPGAPTLTTDQTNQLHALTAAVRHPNAGSGDAAAQLAQAGNDAVSQSRDRSQLLSAVHLSNAQQAAPELAERMTLMIGQKWHEAEIQLEPQGLGKMSIQLSIDQDQKASVQFVVQQGNARELLEQALPKLRDMLASQGVQLGQTSVQQQAAGQQQSQNQQAQQGEAREGGNGWGHRGQNSQGEVVDVQNLAIHSTGAAGIDFYA